MFIGIGGGAGIVVVILIVAVAAPLSAGHANSPAFDPAGGTSAAR